jgi:branched-chain amino acid transport system substrate-binding protein
MKEKSRMCGAGKKRVCAAALAALLAAAPLAGCSKGGGGGDTIKIGGLAPLTGNVSVYGVATNNGAQMAVQAANSKGGVLGKKIQYIYYDEKGDATEAVNAYNKLVQNDEVVGLVGDVTSVPCIAVAQEAVKDGLPMITGTGTAAAITTAGDNVFRACFTDPYQGQVMAEYSAKKLGAKTAAILYDMSDDYSSGVAEAFEKEAKAAGISIVTKQAYQHNDVDFKSQLQTVKGKSPDILFLPVYYQDVALIAVQAKQMGIKATLMGVDGWDGVLEKIDKSNIDAVNGAYFCSQYSAESKDPAVQQFIKDYKAKYKADPNMFAVLGYDAMNILLESIKKAGTTDSAKVVDAMKDIKFKGLTGDITFDKDRNPVKSAAITTIQDGAYKFVEYFKK